MAQEVGITLENPLFRAYVFYTSILVIKMMAMSFLTARQRFKHKAFASPEDVKGLKGKLKVDENVERVRRAHLNDLENIPLFFMISYFYILTNPSAFLAINLFRLYTVARIAHTIVYAVVVIPQPARALSYGIGSLITAFMAVKTLVTFL